MQKHFLSHGSLIRTISHLPLQRRATFSSSCGATAKLADHLAVADEDEAPGSSAYVRRLRTQMPGIIKHKRRLENYASFIGHVDRPIVMKNTKSGRIVARSSLEVTDAEDANGEFRIHIEMWNAMAEMCIQHLKLHDLIHVSGCLQSFENADAGGNCELHHKVTVKNLNYVDKHDHHQACSKSQLESREEDAPHRHQDVDVCGTQEGKSVWKKSWEAFFAEPHEWWDYRKSKRSAGTADFKHKRTGERVWLSPDDPPWIRKQMEVLDSRMMTGPRYDNRLYLWHIFFVDPWDWWDNRKNKKNPRAPDFKNKSTQEALWLDPNDPPWVQKQISLFDARMAEKRHVLGSTNCGVSHFISHFADTGH